MTFFFVWNAYFLLKLYLYAQGTIVPDLVPNLVFLAFVATPLPERFARRAGVTALRQVLNAALAVCLLWHDSYLPPVLRAWGQLEQQGMPSLTYIVFFVVGFFDWPLLAAMVGVLIISLALRRWRAIAVGLTALLLSFAPFYVSWAAAAGKVEKAKPAEAKPHAPGAFLEDFYSRESERVVLFKKPSNPPFDIIVVHVCSMAWSDLKAVHLEQHEFLKGMDYLFTGFNSVSSYSNPAVMRLLRANCGQTPHTDLYNPVPPTCFLYESLKGVGYQNYVVMSHDGKYGHYTEDIKKNGLADATFIVPEKMPPQSIFFDDSKMYSDFDMLKKWLAARNASNAPRAALYFNTVNLHAGSHWVDE
jgi:cellulose synthase operon protein YhjU